MFNVYLLLGGNLGNRAQTLQRAVELIEQKVGLLIRKSSLYETQAWGYTDQPDFLNRAVLVETSLDPFKLLETTQEIELSLGRERKEHWAARTIDIDILFYDDEVIQHSKLNIPHPYIAERKFVLDPLKEIAPDLVHPVLHENITSISARCDDQSEVRIIPGD